MCPACVTTLALIAAGAGSAGGLTAVAVTKWRAVAGAQDPHQDTRAGAPDDKETPR